jgi:protein TonB
MFNIEHVCKYRMLNSQQQSSPSTGEARHIDGKPSIFAAQMIGTLRAYRLSVICVWETVDRMKMRSNLMTTMTFDGSYVSPRRTAARRNLRSPPRVVEIVSQPPAVVAIRAARDPRQSRNKIALIVAIGAAVAFHAVIFNAFNRPLTLAPLLPKVQPMALEIAPPPPPPPPPVIQPKPVPQVVAAKPIARQPPPPSVPVVQSAPDTTEPSADTVQVATAPPPPAPVVAKPAPPPEPSLYAGGYLTPPSPNYPPEAQKRGLQGRVMLKVHVLASGEPDIVTVANSSGFDILDEAAVKGVKAAVFKPAMRGDTPVDAVYFVPINFKHK